MKESVFSTALAGLLYDVGKLIQRSNDVPFKNSEPADTPAWTAQSVDFIQCCIPKKHQASILEGLDTNSPSGSPQIAAVIALADKLSAGEEVDFDAGKHPDQLQIIFDRISLHGTSPTKSHYYPLRTLKLERDLIFPQETRLQNTSAAYSELIAEIQEVAKQPIDDPQTYLENMLYAYKRTTWCVPSAYFNSMSDVSLYDHARMRAALAVCLKDITLEQAQQYSKAVQQQFQGNAKPDEVNLLNQPAALLVGGDISGIQDFIYSISSKRAARTLRGRSFYLQLLTEAVLRYVLKNLGIPYTNVIYSGGGHFFILAPLDAAEKLANIQKQTSQTLLDAHGVSLYLAMGWQEIPYSGFLRGQFPEYWNKMHAKLGKAKQRRYQELGHDLYSAVFEPQPHQGNQEDHCAVCGRDTAGTHLIKDDSEEDRICPMCTSFDTEIGKLLPQSRYLLLAFGDELPFPKRFNALDVLAAFGMRVEFLSGDEKEVVSQKADRGVLWALDETNGVWPVISNMPVARTVHYTVHKVPQGTFEDLAEKTNIKRLGVLRMDVDHLGEIFSRGFGSTREQSIATLVRLSTLSFQMSLFFEGWLQQIASQRTGDVYTVYAGGDDLFLIAPWDQVPDIALQIIDDFAAYTGNHPDIHLSGGMTFIHGKYPVYQAADDSGEAEKMAKNSGRNAFTFLERPWKWDQFKSIKSKKDQLLKIAEQPGAPHSLLQVLQRLAQMESESRNKKHKLVWGPWMWMADYQLKRMSDRSKSTLHPLLEQLRSDVHDDLWQHQDMQQWGTAARWVQLTKRNDEKTSK